MTADDPYIYIGVTLKKEDEKDRPEIAYSVQVAAMARKYGHFSSNLKPNHTTGTGLEFGFPIEDERKALEFLEEALRIEGVAQVVAALGEKGF
jgi:hypothetical protein